MYQDFASCRKESLVGLCTLMQRSIGVDTAAAIKITTTSLLVFLSSKRKLK